MSLLDKIRRARESKVEVAGHTFVIRRPTDAQIAEMANKPGIEYVRRFVVGWDLKEVDLVAGGGPEPVAFSPELWAEWIDDQHQLWEPLAGAILQSFQAHSEARETAAKNS